MENLNTITCPHCHQEFALEEAIEHQMEARIRERVAQEQQPKIAALEKRETALQEKEASLQAMKEGMEVQVKQRVTEELKAKETAARKQITSEIREEVALEIQALEEKAAIQAKQFKEAKTRELKLIAEKEELERKREDLELEVKRKMADERQKIATDARAKALEEVMLDKADWQKQMEDLQAKLVEATRKAEQGSQKLQGEVQEIELAKLLTVEFIRDTVEEVKSGKLGADVLLHIHNEFGKACGTICFESKRTLSFQDVWIPKLKEDMQRTDSIIGVIVTEAMPAGMKRFGLRNGIWVCNIHEVASLTSALRQQLVAIWDVRQSQENKGSKMELLYDYLSSEDFVHTITTVVDGFQTLREQVIKERNAMERQWVAREKQLEVVLKGLNRFFGSVKGIGGSIIPEFKALEEKSDVAHATSQE
jgi:hypothetical protein